jgi:hypothetical protein
VNTKNTIENPSQHFRGNAEKSSEKKVKKNRPRRDEIHSQRSEKVPEIVLRAENREMKFNFVLRRGKSLNFLPARQGKRT